MSETNRGLAAEVEALAARLRYLEDCETIRQMMYAYARGVDRVDQSLLEPIYHEDAFDSHGNWEGSKPEVIEILMTRGRSGSASASTHHLGNILIDLKGDLARVETYFVAYQRQHRDGKTFIRSRAGRYLDRFERRDGTWRVAYRQVVDDWNRLDEVVATSADAEANREQGKRDASDASYRHLEGFMAGWAPWGPDGFRVTAVRGRLG